MRPTFEVERHGLKMRDEQKLAPLAQPEREPPWLQCFELRGLGLTLGVLTLAELALGGLAPASVSPWPSAWS